MLGTLILTVKTGPVTGKKFVFNDRNTFLCGRRADCHLFLPHDSFISGHHFLLEVHLPHVRLRDLGSLHGTYVNRKKYGGRKKQATSEEATRQDCSQVELHDGDEIIVGTTVFQVRLEGR